MDASKSAEFVPDYDYRRDLVDIPEERNLVIEEDRSDSIQDGESDLIQQNSSDAFPDISSYSVNEYNNSDDIPDGRSEVFDDANMDDNSAVTHEDFSDVSSEMSDDITEIIPETQETMDLPVRDPDSSEKPVINGDTPPPDITTDINLMSPNKRFDMVTETISPTPVSDTMNTQPPPQLDMYPSVRCYFTPEQRARLENIFKANAYPTDEDRTSIAAELAVCEKRIKVWFTNRRSKLFRSGEAEPAAKQRFTVSQKHVLGLWFDRNKYPDRQTVNRLMEQINASSKRIKIWFNNQRVKKKCTRGKRLMKLGLLASQPPPDIQQETPAEEIKLYNRYDREINHSSMSPVEHSMYSPTGTSSHSIDNSAHNSGEYLPRIQFDNSLRNPMNNSFRSPTGISTHDPIDNSMRNVVKNSQTSPMDNSVRIHMNNSFRSPMDNSFSSQTNNLPLALNNPSLIEPSTHTRTISRPATPEPLNLAYTQTTNEDIPEIHSTLPIKSEQERNRNHDNKSEVSNDNDEPLDFSLPKPPPPLEYNTPQEQLMQEENRYADRDPNWLADPRSHLPLYRPPYAQWPLNRNCVHGVYPPYPPACYHRPSPLKVNPYRYPSGCVCGGGTLPYWQIPVNLSSNCTGFAPPYY